MFATTKLDSGTKLLLSNPGRPVEDPLRKREQFAVSLRKAKKKDIIEGRRMKILLPNKENAYEEYMGHWHGRWEKFATYC